MLQVKDRDRKLQASIEMTAEGILSEVVDVEQGLITQISQTAGEIRSEVSNVEEGLMSQISQSAEGILAIVTNTEESLQTLISANANAISLQATSITDMTDDVDGVKTRLSAAEQLITSEAIVTTVRTSTEYTSDLAGKASTSSVGGLSTRVTNAESSIRQTAEDIALKVSKTDFTGNKIIAELNLTSTTATIKASNIDLDGITTVNQNLLIGGVASGTKEIKLYTSPPNYYARLYAFSNEGLPALSISASTLLLGSRVYIGSSIENGLRVLTEGDAVAVTAVFG